KFFCFALEIVSREHPERDNFDVDLLTPFQKFKDFIGPTTMAGGGGGAKGAGPAAVAIQNDADVAGQITRGEVAREAAFIKAVQHRGQAHKHSGNDLLIAVPQYCPGGPASCSNPGGAVWASTASNPDGGMWTSAGQLTYASVHYGSVG